MNLQLEHKIFNDKDLILVLGSHDGKLYEVTNSMIERIGEFTAQDPDTQYSDNEGHFEQRSADGNVTSGGVVEPHKDTYIRNFKHELGDLLKKPLNDEGYKKLYILRPSHVKGHVEDVLEDFNHLEIVRNVVYSKDGNYTNLPENEIVDLIIEDEKEEYTEPMSEEEKKILDTPQL